MISEIRKYFIDNLDKAKMVLSETKSKIKNLRENNINLAKDYFEYGIIGECKNRLKIILMLWPNEEYAKYLLGLVYILNREKEKALKYLSNITGEKEKLASKLCDVVNTGKIEKIIEAYKTDQNLFNLEGFINDIKA